MNIKNLEKLGVPQVSLFLIDTNSKAKKHSSINSKWSDELSLMSKANNENNIWCIDGCYETYMIDMCLMSHFPYALLKYFEPNWN